ncbi:MAG TPA: type II toxin-antitoxin system VapC family toxin [Sphingomonas sp.]
MTIHLLDTNILSDIIRYPLGKAADRLEMEGDRALTSVIVAGELRYGVERRGGADLRARVEGALNRIPVMPLGDEVSMYYARVRADLERRGLPIGGNDLLIAAHALSLGATLVTDNLREFTRVEGLAVENWLRDDHAESPSRRRPKPI